MNSHHQWWVGIARRKITPPLNVELAGLGYYLNRTAHRVRDDLTVTALVIESPRGGRTAIVALDILYCDEAFASSIRIEAAAKTGIPGECICINCSHSHNAPTAAFVRGLGELDPSFISFLTQETIRAISEASNSRQSASLHVGFVELDGLTFNRTRENGPRDTRLSVLSARYASGRTFAVALNFHSHLTAHLESDLRAISRDWSGEVIDRIEAELPGVTAMYLQGTCGDVILRPEFNSTERSSEPAKKIANSALAIIEHSRLVGGNTIATSSKRINLPTRRWTHDEIAEFREEGDYRLKSGDTQGWLNGIARAIVTYPDRLPIRYGGSVAMAVEAVSRFALEWAEATLKNLNTRAEYVTSEVQAIRVGDVFFSANPAELFTSLGLELRRKSGIEDLFILGYSNGAIGYLPDAYDVNRKSYAAIQSPKFAGQFPFVAASGESFVTGALDCMRATASKEM